MLPNNFHPLTVPSSANKGGWIGIDLDGTLAVYDEWQGAGHIEAPIPAMVGFVQGLLGLGWDVRLFTARAGLTGKELGAFMQAWHKWSTEQFGRALTVTDRKDFKMIQLYDDRAIPVEHNSGRLLLALRSV